MRFLSSPSCLFGATVALIGAPLAEAQQATTNDNELVFQRLTNRAAERQFTARDLLGRDVYDPRGDKIGKIDDIELGSGFPQQLALTLGQNQSQRDPRRDQAAEPPPGVGSSTPTQKAGAVDQPGDPAVYVSVGGVLGFGANIIRAPAAALRYHEDSDRLILTITNDDASRLTEAGDKTAKGRAPVGEPGTAATLSDAHADPERDRRILIEAIRAEPSLSEAADRINIMVNHSDIVVFGTVEDETERTAVMALIEKHTDKPVRDRLTVSSVPR